MPYANCSVQFSTSFCRAFARAEEFPQPVAAGLLPSAKLLRGEWRLRGFMSYGECSVHLFRAGVCLNAQQVAERRVRLRLFQEQRRVRLRLSHKAECLQHVVPHVVQQTTSILGEQLCAMASARNPALVPPEPQRAAWKGRNAGGCPKFKLSG
jgi:hypothetical protein